MEKTKVLTPYRKDLIRNVNIYRLPYGEGHILYEDKTPEIPIKIVEHEVTHQVYYYKEIPDFDGYGITFDGVVLSFKSRHINTAADNDYPLKVRVIKPGLIGARREYAAVNLNRNCVAKQYSVHRLVLECWVGLPTGFNPDGTPMRTPPECNHKDINSKNNFYQNLEWCDRFYNNAHRCGVEDWAYTHKTKETGRKPHKPVEHSREYYINKRAKYYEKIEKLSQENDKLADEQYEIKDISETKLKTRIYANCTEINRLADKILEIDEILNDNKQCA